MNTKSVTWANFSAERLSECFSHHEWMTCFCRFSSEKTDACGVAYVVSYLSRNFHVLVPSSFPEDLQETESFYFLVFTICDKSQREYAQSSLLILRPCPLDHFQPALSPDTRSSKGCWQHSEQLSSTLPMLVLSNNTSTLTLFLTAMSIELQSCLSPWGQSTRTQWRLGYFMGDIMLVDGS